MRYFIEQFTNKDGTLEYARHCKGESGPDDFADADGGRFTYQEITEKECIIGFFKWESENGK